jgi:hypothetical protein
MAGKKGKCPKCSSAFAVPTLEELAADQEHLEPPKEEPVAAGVAASSSTAEGATAAQSSLPITTSASGKDLASGNGADSRPDLGMGSGKGKASGEVFVFLCPNGHKLNGPPSLKGKAGKCPHCGAKFRIPTDEELEAPEEEEVPTGEAEEEEEEIADGQIDDDGGEFRLNFSGLGQEEEVVDAAIEEPLAPPPPGPAALGYILGRLWDRKDDTNEIEIFMVEGEIMSPDRFSEILSSSDYGVFATKEGDGTYAVTVIPWSAVRRIGMRKVSELPDDSFR